FGGVLRVRPTRRQRSSPIPLRPHRDSWRFVSGNQGAFLETRAQFICGRTIGYAANFTQEVFRQ
ncbi:MAG: hypothetical protein WBW88_00410, partial [Rhodothermales bacterium]